MYSTSDSTPSVTSAANVARSNEATSESEWYETREVFYAMFFIFVFCLVIVSVGLIMVCCYVHKKLYKQENRVEPKKVDHRYPRGCPGLCEREDGVHNSQCKTVAASHGDGFGGEENEEVVETGQDKDRSGDGRGSAGKWRKNERGKRVQEDSGVIKPVAKHTILQTANLTSVSETDEKSSLP